MLRTKRNNITIMEGDIEYSNQENDFTFSRSNTISTIDEQKNKINSRKRIFVKEHNTLSTDPSSAVDDRDSIQRTMSLVLVIAQCFALCPVKGITSHQAEDLRFTWRTFRTYYSIFITIIMFINIIFVILWFFKVGLNFRTAGALIFYLNGFLCCIIFITIAMKWPVIAQLWQTIERSQLQYGYPKNLRFKIWTLTIVILIVAVVETSLSHLTNLYQASQCASGTADLIRRYFIIKERNIFQVVKFSPVLPVFTVFSNIMAVFYWSFTDIFIIVISIALSSRFNLINKQLMLVRGQAMTQTYWKAIREDYEILAYLTKVLDSGISSLILLSFATDLFYICQQLLYSMNHIMSSVHRAYVFVSFSYLTLRTCAKLLCAAKVYEESQVPKEVLYSVPSEGYNIETRRFLCQVTTDSVALTGQNFFTVTRTVLLTLAGTIVTYEIVLVQFGTTSEGVDVNLTELCYNLTSSSDI